MHIHILENIYSDKQIDVVNGFKPLVKKLNKCDINKDKFGQLLYQAK